MFGIARSGPAGKEVQVISRLSPYYNPLVDDKGALFETEHKAISACAKSKSEEYFVHFLKLNESVPAQQS